MKECVTHHACDCIMERTNIAERKLEKLKRLILLTDPVVSLVEMGDLSIRQWNEFIKEFPDEGE